MEENIFVTYNEEITSLLEKIKKEGILVETMEKGTPFSFDFEKHKFYKKALGATYVKDRHGKIINVYIAYQDYHGTIKYYDYPQ